MLAKSAFIFFLAVFVAVLLSSYYNNKEGFDDITNAIKTVQYPMMNPTMNPKNSNIDSTNIVPDTSSIPVRNDVVPTVSLSGTGYEAMSHQQKAELLRDIQKVVRNEILAQRNTTPVINTSDSMHKTDSSDQGKEYNMNCNKSNTVECPASHDSTCPSLPDMSEYIKKDTIPCWGCKLDY